MIRTVALMGTIVTIHVVDHLADDRRTLETEETVERAFGWFRQVEACCTRFDAQSEVMQLTSRIGVPVRASEILYQAIQFALEVAETMARPKAITFSIHAQEHPPIGRHFAGEERDHESRPWLFFTT